MKAFTCRIPDELDERIQEFMAHNSMKTRQDAVNLLLTKGLDGEKIVGLTMENVKLKAKLEQIASSKIERIVEHVWKEGE